MTRPDIKAKIENLRLLMRKRGFMSEDDDRIYQLGFKRETAFDLFISKTIRYALHDDDAIINWMDARLASVQLRTEIIPVNEIEGWHIDEETGNICNDSGRFFTITGLKVRHRMNHEELLWDQPIIDQPEVGILGILATKISGVLHFCLQAKEEPGNINSVQLSPTVQATYSNYTQSHGGGLPPFIRMFLDPPKEKILFSRLQAEDGGRFLYKSNKNIIVMIHEDECPDLPEDFIWLTLRQIGNLMQHDNLINSCARSVLSCLI